MKRKDLTLLLKLRRTRQERALSVLTSRHGQFQRAEQEVSNAGAILAGHAEHARSEERRRLAGMIGRQLSASDLGNLQSSLNALADRRQDLAAAEQEAAKTLEARRAEMEKARIEFNQRYRQAEKLAGLIEHWDAKQSRRQLGLAEAQNEELPGASSRPEHSHGSSDKRNGDA